jgi:hypothetical protein
VPRVGFTLSSQTKNDRVGRSRVLRQNAKCLFDYIAMRMIHEIEPVPMQDAQNLIVRLQSRVKA